MGKQEELVAAVKDQDISTVLKLIGKVAKSKLIGSAKKLNFNHVDSNGLSLLHYAASSDNIEIVKILIEHGATVDAMDSHGIRPLHVAARQGNARCVAHLISCGSSVNDPAYDGSTPLHLTCEPGHMETVDLLLNHDGDPTAYNCEHKTAFDIACEFGNLKVVEKLVASPHCGQLLREYKRKTKDVKRTTCLHLAAKNGNVHILRFLLEFGFDFTRQTANGNCLHEAVMHGQIKAVKFLLDWGVDLHCRNSFNQTALDIVHSSQKLHQNEKLVRLLTEAPFQPLTVRAVRSYHCAQQHNQLSFREGDLIRVVERHSDETWKGYLFRDSDESQQHVAYFPSSEVEIVRFSDATDDGLGPLHFPSQTSANLLSQCPVSSHQRLSLVSPRPVKPSAAPSLSLSTDRADRTAEWIVQSAASDVVAVATEVGRSGSPMSTKDNVSESNRSSTSSSSGSSGYLDGNSQVNAYGLVCQPNRLSGQSCESGVASLWPSTNCIPVSTSRSSHSSTLDWPDEGGDHCSGRPANISELFQQGLKDSDVMYVWLHQLQLTDCYQLFVQAGYDMPTISRMTPEDLTAIGITQPSVRKHLTSEISRLNLTDKIPNFRSNNLLEWLQLLNLEEYHSTLMREGYTNVDRIMEITWEDLEDVGMHKLGHQKKLLLAIDRMKKLSSGGKSNDPDIPRHPDLRPPGVETSPKSVGTRFAKPGPKNQPLGFSEVILKKEDSGRLAEASAGPQVKSVIRLPPQTPFVHPASRAALQTTSASPSPEVIAIHVNRTVNLRTGSIKERSGVKTDFQHVMYKSFHGNPSSQQDFAGRHVDLDGDMTPTNDRASLSTDEMGDGLGPPDNFRPPVAAKPYRRASAGGNFSGAAAAGDILACLPGQCGNASRTPGDFHGDPQTERNLRNLDVGVVYSSAPTTPSHSALGGGGSPAGTRSKKIVPQPPKRSNSIKDKLKMSTTGGQGQSFPFVPRSTNSAANQPPPASADPTSHVAAQPRHGSQGPSAETDNPLSRVIARLEWKEDQVVRPAKSKASDVSGGSSSAAAAQPGVDCNTLPFANENVGTIRPRNPGKSAAPRGGGDPRTFQGSQEGSPGPRRSLCGSESVRGDTRLPPPNNETKKPPPVPSKKQTSAKNEQTGAMQQKQSQSVTGGGGGGGDVFDDIDNLFQGLTKELNQMLTFDG